MESHKIPGPYAQLKNFILKLTFFLKKTKRFCTPNPKFGATFIFKINLPPLIYIDTYVLCSCLIIILCYSPSFTCPLTTFMVLSFSSLNDPSTQRCIYRLSGYQVGSKVKAAHWWWDYNSVKEC